jgi:hypothetical protein
VGEVVFMAPLTELTPEQKEHWEEQLEHAERAVEVAKRMLGLIPIEVGVPYGKEPTN